MKIWNYNDIAIFINVAQENSFTAAAKKIGLPKSTVSRRISQLEDDLKIRLLERTSRKLTLTAQGKKLYLENKQLFEFLNENLRQLVDNNNDMSGTIKITSPILLADSLLNKMLIDFQTIHPKIEFNLHTSDEVQDLLFDEFDLAVRVGPLTDSQFICQKLWQPKLVLCASPTYLSKNTVNTPEDILNQSFIIGSREHMHLSFRHKTTHKVSNIAIRGKQYSNNMAFNLQAMISHKGISGMPKFYVQAALDRGDLVEILPDYEFIYEKEFFAVYPSKRHLSKKLSTLIKYLKQEFSKIE